MKYTDLVFDLYGTLVDIHTEENDLVWEKTAIYFGFYGAHYTPEGLKKAFQAAMDSRKAAAGQSYECFPEIPFEQVMAQLFRDKGVVENVENLGMNAAQLFRISSIAYVKLYPYVLQALQVLRQKGFRLWLLSNAQRAFTAYELEHLQLGPYLDGIYISSDYGCGKPDPRFYRALMQERGLESEKCLMIGNDRKTDIAGAQKIGMATLYMHTELTPRDQKAADPKLHPSVAPAECRDFEYEGDDWAELVTVIQQIAG